MSDHIEHACPRCGSMLCAETCAFPTTDAEIDAPARDARPVLDLEPIEARAEKAWPGPWYVERRHVTTALGAALVKHAICEVPETYIAHCGNDLTFIAKSRTDIPALSAEVRALRLDLARVTAERDAAVKREVAQSIALEDTNALLETAQRERDAARQEADLNDGWLKKHCEERDNAVAREQEAIRSREFAVKQAAMLKTQRDAAIARAEAAEKERDAYENPLVQSEHALRIQAERDRDAALAVPADARGVWLCVRPAVAAFAEAMEAQLRANDGKGDWIRDSAIGLFEHMMEEVEELREEIRLPVVSRAVTRIQREAADVGNMAMMVADVCGALGNALPAPIIGARLAALAPTPAPDAKENPHA